MTGRVGLALCVVLSLSVAATGDNLITQWLGDLTGH